MQYKQLKRKCFLVHEIWNMMVGEATKGLGIAARQGITLRRCGWRCVRRRFEGVREIGMGRGDGEWLEIQVEFFEWTSSPEIYTSVNLLSWAPKWGVLGKI